MAPYRKVDVPKACPNGWAIRQLAPVTTTSVVLRQVGMMQEGPTPQPIDAGVGVMPPQAVPQQPGYVQLGAPLYPSPRPNIPIWTGSTMITNQAFAPHEMLYPHTYRAMYPAVLSPRQRGLDSDSVRHSFTRTLGTARDSGSSEVSIAVSRFAERGLAPTGNILLGWAVALSW